MKKSLKSSSEVERGTVNADVPGSIPGSSAISLTRQTSIKSCKICGPTEFYRQNNGRWRCRRCIIDAVKRWKKNTKLKVIEYFGGKCKICSYSRAPSVLELHHLDPTKKEFSITNGSLKSWKRIETELKKCVLLCANCHREVHSGLYPEYLLNTD